MNAKQRRQARRSALHREAQAATGYRQTPLEKRLAHPLSGNPMLAMEYTITHYRRDEDESPEFCKAYKEITGEDAPITLVPCDKTMRYRIAKGKSNSVHVKTDATEYVARKAQAYRVNKLPTVKGNI